MAVFIPPEVPHLAGEACELGGHVADVGQGVDSVDEVGRGGRDSCKHECAVLRVVKAGLEDLREAKPIRDAGG